MPGAERFRPLVFGLAAVGLIAGWSLLSAPDQIIYNHSPSLPAGFYVRTADPPSRGRLIRFATPETAAAYARERGDDIASVTFLKPVGATAGDQVCRQGETLSVNGTGVASARERDGAGRLLPAWSGCRTLRPGEFLALATRVPNSFDSRYYGPVPRGRILGVYRPLWTFSP
ncbi:MAG TPA: S26 family signal peptidase [Rhodospirillales bacterium]|nr:S26 family signal peptidase [Rhodospirillales bacterium]